MADAVANIGIRAEGIRPLATLRKDNYRAWSSKLKAQLKVMDCWGLVSAIDLVPAAATPENTNAERIAINLTIAVWTRKRDRAAALLITSVSDEESHVIHAVEDNPVEIWDRLKEKFERRSEAEAETAQLQFLDFTHKEGEDANAMIERFETIVTTCTDQGVVMVADEQVQKRMLLARPADRYAFLKQSYLLAPARTRPDLVGLKAQMRDIDAEFQKTNSLKTHKAGMANRAETEAAWSQSTGGGRSTDRGSGRFAGRGGRGSAGRGRGDSSSGARELTCYCCGQKGHIKPNCSKKDEKCRKCGKVGHLLAMCKEASERASERASASGSGGGSNKKAAESAHVDSMEGFKCEVFTGDQQPEAMVVEVDLAGSDQRGNETWLGDSGSSHHIKSTSAGMIDVKPCPAGTRIRQVQGVVDVAEWGTVLLEVDGEHGKHVMKLSETLIVPDINVNLFSLQRVIKHGYLPVYGEVEGKCIIKKRTSAGSLVQVAAMSVIDGRSTLDCKIVDICRSGSGAAPLTSVIDSFKVELSMGLLHRRLGHSGSDALKKMFSGDMVRGISKVKKEELGVCDWCKLGKLAQKPHPTAAVDNKGSDLLDLVVVDLAGPNRPQTLGGKVYDMVIVDTFSQRAFVQLLAKKSDAAEALMRWIPMVELQTGKKLKRLRSDNGGEFLSGKFQDWLSHRGVVQQTTPSYSPQSNGIAERMNRTLQDKARTMLLESGLPGSLWGEVLLTACHLRNLTPTSTLSVTPLQMWTGKQPSIEHLRVIGSKAFCQLNKVEQVGKYGAKAWMGPLVGYSVDTPGYRVWDPTTHKVWDVRGPDFDELVAGGWWKQPTSVVKAKWGGDEPLNFMQGLDLEEDPPAAGVPPPVDGITGGGGDDASGDDGSSGGAGPFSDVDEEETSVPEGVQPPRMSGRERRGVPPLRLIEIMAAAADVDDGGAPSSYGEALGGPEGNGWRKAFAAEVKSLNDNKVYSVVDRPSGKKVVKAKWVLRRKLLPNGELDKLKARIVAKGFTQREGIDYEETFSPTVRFESVRLMVAAAAADGLHTHQMDVTTAFLYASLEEEVYMELMEGMEGYGIPGKVARLWRAIYGLKQASRMWNHHINGILKSMGFERLSGDHGVYFKWDGENRVWLALYVDDIFLTGKNLANIEESKKTLGVDMKVKDLGVAQYLLGIELRRRQLGMADGDILLVQEKYVHDILKQFDMVGCKPVVRFRVTGLLI